MIGYRFVEDHRADHEVSDLCRVASVSRSGYYAWRTRPLSDAFLDDAWLANTIFDIWVASRRTYGRPRVWGQLRRRGIRVSAKRVGRIMADNGWAGAHSRRRWRSGPRDLAPAGDLLARDFTAAAPDLRWVADITEFACCDGKLYLAAIKDLYDQTIVGWSMSERQTTDLVVAALVMALGRRDTLDGLIHHADHGCQYTSIEFTNRLADWGLIGSYGSIGDCYDNSAMETTWAAFKREIDHIWGPWKDLTRSELRTILFDYIETFYNRSRHQARLGHRTPAETYAAHQAA